MTKKELQKIIDELDDSAIICTPDMYISNDGEVSYVEVDYVTTPCAPYYDIRGFKKEENNDLLVIW